MPEMLRSISLPKRLLALVVLLLVAFVLIRLITSVLFGLFFLALVLLVAVLVGVAILWSSGRLPPPDLSAFDESRR